MNDAGADEPRFLARASERGYVHTAALALPGEPEAISADEPTDERTRTRSRTCTRASRWRDANAQIEQAVTGFRERSGHIPPNVVSGVRAVLRASEQGRSEAAGVSAVAWASVRGCHLSD